MAQQQAQWSNPTDIVASWLSSCSLCVLVCKPVCVHTWNYQHVWGCISRNTIHSVIYLRSCCKLCAKKPLHKYILCHTTLSPAKAGVDAPGIHTVLQTAESWSVFVFLVALPLTFDYLFRASVLLLLIYILTRLVPCRAFACI